MESALSLFLSENITKTISWLCLVVSIITAKRVKRFFFARKAFTPQTFIQPTLIARWTNVREPFDRSIETTIA